MTKKFTIVATSVLCVSASAVAGIGSGGGSPPAREVLTEMLMSQPLLDGGLFDNGQGDVSLLTRRALQPQMAVTKLEPADASPEFELQTFSHSLKLTDSDFTALRDRTKAIDAVSSEGRNFSFVILPSDSLDSVVLKDRRSLMRESISPKSLSSQ
jgi:hypothetical protein